ncbi:hypothetical protein HDU80_010195 [Chytriomyces hyalinus]|nr:hypothetical protein HDU80_010195 [Chytriomyces hyalinus]
MPAFNNIAVVVGTSTIGQTVIKDLLATKGEFASAILLTRDPESKAFKELIDLGAVARKIPFELSAESIPALTESLNGVDALVSEVGGQGIGSQEHLIHASNQAGVKRFIPSEKLLRSNEISSKLEHTFIENGFFIEGFFSPFLNWNISAASVAVNIPGAGDVPLTVTHHISSKTSKFEGDQFTWNQARELVSKALVPVPGVKSTFSTSYTSVEHLEKKFELLKDMSG